MRSSTRWSVSSGRSFPPETWESGYKDTVIVYPGQLTRVKAKFDLPGLYVWHCHILEHEDNEMMRPYFVGPPVTGSVNVCKQNSIGTPLSGWNFTVDSGTPQTTDGTGCTVFNNVLPGVHTVTETMKPGWMNITPVSQSVTVLREAQASLTFVNELTPVKQNLTVTKFYDANANGVMDGAEPAIIGWNVTVNAVFYNTPVDTLLAPGTYTVTERASIIGKWRNTTPMSFTVIQNGTVYFGNLCLGKDAAHAEDFWKTRRGLFLITPTDLARLSALNLKDEAGADFNPATNAAFSTWLNKANDKNMAYALSAELAAMDLNVNTLVPGTRATDLIYAPGTTSANTLGYATVGSVMTEANNALAADGLTLKGDPNRAYQTALYNALNDANKNRNFVQPVPCAFAFL